MVAVFLLDELLLHFFLHFILAPLAVLLLNLLFALFLVETFVFLLPAFLLFLWAFLIFTATTICVAHTRATATSSATIALRAFFAFLNNSTI